MIARPDDSSLIEEALTTQLRKVYGAGNAPKVTISNKHFAEAFLDNSVFINSHDNIDLAISLAGAITAHGGKTVVRTAIVEVSKDNLLQMFESKAFLQSLRGVLGQEPPGAQKG